MAKRIKKKISATEKKYNQIRKNLTQKLNRMEQRGFYFPKTMQNTEILPEKPKKVTQASIRKLQKLNEKLYKKAIWVDFETGEIKTGIEGQKALRKKAAKKAAETRRIKKEYEEEFALPSEQEIAVANFKAAISSFGTTPFGDMMRAWVDKVVSIYGVGDAGTMLIEAQESGLHIGWRVLSYEQDFSDFVSQVFQYLPDVGILGTEDFFEAFEEEQAIAWLDK